MADLANGGGEPGVLTYRSGKRSVSADRSAATAGMSGLQFLTALAEQLSRNTVDLPCFPNIVIKIRDALNNPETSSEEAVRLVGAEPRLAVKLIQTANSVAFNPTGKPVTELRTAMTRLGRQLVQGAAMAFAVQQMKNEPVLRSIQEPLTALWKDSIVVASISQVVARRTKVKAEEAFLTGLLHGIGRLYIMADAITHAPDFATSPDAAELIAGWHPSIGKAVLENWHVAESMAEAVGDQKLYDRQTKREPDLTDVLIVSIILGRALNEPEPRVIETDGVTPFQVIGLKQEEFSPVLKHAAYQVDSLQEALGC